MKAASIQRVTKLPPPLKESFMQLIKQSVEDFPNSAPRPDLPKQITAGPFLLLFRERFTDWVIANNVCTDDAVALWDVAKQQVLVTCAEYTAALQ
jgi:hypothetical protein